MRKDLIPKLGWYALAGIVRQVPQFESDLIIAFAGGSMTDRIGFFKVSDFDLTLCNQRPGQRRTQQILSLVYGIGAKSCKHVIPNKFLGQILDVRLGCTGLVGILFDLFQIIFLPDGG